MSWHVDRDLLDRYAAGTLDEPRAFSVEAHLVECAACRHETTAVVDPVRLRRGWEDIVDEIDRPRQGPVERLLVRLGVSEHAARLLAATPSLRLSWMLAVTFALAFAMLAARAADGMMLFLTVAPLLPVAGVAAAYGPGVDPTYEVALAAPMQSWKLLLLRATAVLVGTTLLGGVAALLLPTLDVTVAAWLLPSLGLVVTTLALATVVAPMMAAGAVSVTWLATVSVVSRADEAMVLFGGAAQVGFTALIVLAVLVLAVRRDTLEMEGAT